MRQIILVVLLSVFVQDSVAAKIKAWCGVNHVEKAENGARIFFNKGTEWESIDGGEFSKNEIMQRVDSTGNVKEIELGSEKHDYKWVYKPFILVKNGKEVHLENRHSYCSLKVSNDGSEVEARSVVSLPGIEPVHYKDTIIVDPIDNTE
jgi:hypothetical protein